MKIGDEFRVTGNHATSSIPGDVILAVFATFSLCYGVAIITNYRGFARYLYDRSMKRVNRYPFVGSGFGRVYPFEMFRLGGGVGILVAIIAYALFIKFVTR